MKSQNQEIYEYLKTGASLTAKGADRRFQCSRLAARICDLRDAGVDIVTTTIKRRSKRTGKPVAFAQYSMTGAVK